MPASRHNPRRPKRRRLPPEDRRNELLEAALEVLGTVGPHKARVEDVTRTAGASKGTFYVYFDSWDDLIKAVQEHVLGGFASAARARIESGAIADWSWFEAECIHAVDFILELGDLRPAIFHASSKENALPPEPVAVAVVERILDEAIDAGACVPLDTKLIAPLVFGVVRETANAITRFGDREARLEAMLGLLRAWLKPGDASASQVKKER